MTMKVFLVAGARPNFMKVAPIYDEMKKNPEIFDPLVVHTGQHYDQNMSKVFFEDLELPRPDIYLDVGSGSHAAQTAEIMRRFEPQVLEHKPDLVIVVGDVNSTLACALIAKKMGIPSKKLSRFWQSYETYLESKGKSEAQPNKRIRSHEAPLIAHVEAGERSFDFSMPEEINRVETDVLSDILFTTSADSDENLLAEGIDPSTIFRVGNIMIDSLQKYLHKAAHSNVLDTINQNLPEHVQSIKANEFALVTLHRPGNVDDPESLSMILRALKQVSQQVPIIFPVHPRTRKLISKLDQTFVRSLAQSPLLLTDPFGYLDFLHLQKNARLVLTDSGGVQVETSYLGVPCLTLRPNTEWRVTLREGTNRLVAPDEVGIIQAFEGALSQDKKQPANIEFWDGRTAERIVRHLMCIFELT